MADNFIANPGAGGDTFAADEIAGVKFPRSKLGFGADGAYADVSDTHFRLYPLGAGDVDLQATLKPARSATTIDDATIREFRHAPIRTAMPPL